MKNDASPARLRLPCRPGFSHALALSTAFFLAISLSSCGDGSAETAASNDHPVSEADASLPEDASISEEPDASAESEGQCGDGVRQEGELCDGKDGIPLSCAEFSPNTAWAEGGSPVCNDTCDAILPGTCRQIREREITFLNWNVQAEYASWGAPLVPPRAERLGEAVSSWKENWPQMPAAIAIVEASPSWHAPQYTKMFNDLGYYWVDDFIEFQDKLDDFECGENNENVVFDLESGLEDPRSASCFLMSTILYRKADFDLIAADYVKLKPDWNSPFVNNKIIATCAVLSEKATGQLFIPCATHWLANDGAHLGDGLSGIIGPVIERERGRAEGAHIAAAFVQRLIAAYPDAHVFFGGDFNTLDMDIIFKSPTASAILGSDWGGLAKFINFTLIGSDYTPIDENFRGGHAVFSAESGLSDARRDAKERRVVQDPPGDVKTTSDPNLPDFLSDLEIPVVIDYAFHSPSMDIVSYEVVLDAEGTYEAISDHYPLKTVYSYRAPDAADASGD